MNVIVLATFCFLACDFCIYGLIHWVREKRRKHASNVCCQVCERRAYETIAKSWSLSRKT